MDTPEIIIPPSAEKVEEVRNMGTNTGLDLIEAERIAAAIKNEESK
ncbi:gp104 [Rhodococcus phage ReqiDocB7]|nr:gp104 [Rhodococcus phage ReqiDocB7]ADD80890.1 gp104 [Rhodococcus phage ReqiDocB7]